MAGNFVEELVAFLGWKVDSKELTQFEQDAESVKNTIKTMAAAVGVAAVGVSTFLTITNQATAQNAALAKSVGISTEKLKALTGALHPLGFETENVVDLVEEMNNKIGESSGLGQPISGVTDSLKILNLEFQKLKTLSPEEQFTTILDAALKLDDAQQASSALDMLMGGEANKIVGYLRSQNTELVDLLEHYSKLNFLTTEGSDGAVKFDKSVGELLYSVRSIGSEIAGLSGGPLSDLINDFNKWIIANRELIKLKIKEWADRITKGLKTLWRWTKGLYTKISDLVDIFGGFENLARLVGIAIGSIMSTRIISMMVTFTNALIKAGIAATLLKTSAALISLAVAGTIILLGLLAEDLYAFFTGGDSLVGELGAKIAEFAHANIRPFIASLLGMTPEEFDMAVVKVITRVQNFFTKDIPDAYNWFVDDFEKAIKLAIDGMYPVIGVLYDFFVEVLDKIIGYVGQTAGRIKDSIGAGFKNAIASIAGVDPTSIKDIIAGRASVSAQSALGAGPGAQLANMVKNTVNNAKATISQSNSINITQQPGESSDNLVRKMKDMLSAELTRATKAAAGGIS